jgi:hypothetical protein
VVARGCADFGGVKSDLSYPGSIFSESAIRLETLKRLAQSKDSAANKLAQFSVGDHLFEVRDRGRFPFEFILVDRWYRLELSGKCADRVPLAHAKLASEALTFEGPGALEADLRSVVETLGTVEGDATVGRVDLCVDFVTATPVADLQERAWVTRARTFSRHTVKRRFSGLSIGLGGIMQARLYDKTLEIETSGKTYLFDLWRDFGWDSEQRIWRLEFQFRREVLRGLGVTTFPSLLARLSGLWAYATGNWLRLTVPDPADKTQSRWPLHLLWVALQGADWGVESRCLRQTPLDRPPGDRSLFVNGLSGITSFMAREGITDPGEGIRAFFRAARDYHDRRSYLTGKSLDDYLIEKTELKARRFNSMVNDPPDGGLHPADAAVAKEYRKRSDGA